MKNYSKNRISITFEPYDLERMKEFVGEDKQFTTQAALVRYATTRFLDYLTGVVVKEENKK